jgi:lathosterol oxidase
MSIGELSANGIAVMAYPLIHAFVLGRTTPLELVWFVQLVSQAIGCVEHSGYSALHPLVFVNPKRFPPWLFSTTKHHDDHHQYFHGNYGGYLAIWDTVMGTTMKKSAQRERAI